MKTGKIFCTLGIALLGWVLGSAGAFLAFWLQFLKSIKLESMASNSGFLPSWHWQVHPVCYVLGAVLSLVCFAVVWRLILRRTLFTILPLKKIWPVIWILLALLALFIQFMAFWFGMMITIGFNTPYPEWTSGFIFVYLGFALILMTADTVRHVRQNKQQTEAEI
jgi:hypothetical protein